jgi:hypothetical protein
MNSKIVKGVIATAAAVALTPMFASTAFAEGNGTTVGKADYLRMHALVGADNSKSDCSTIGWQKVNRDSPIDTNKRALVVTVCEGDYAEAYSRRALHIDSPAADVQNLSFDVRTEDIGAGAPRISVVFDNGDVAYLSAAYCAEDITASSGTWSRADFTGDVTDCGFYVSGSTAGFYQSDGAQSAWDAYAAANPDQVVSYAFLVFDEQGSYQVDRVAFGSGHLYNYGPHRAVTCTTENDC